MCGGGAVDILFRDLVCIFSISNWHSEWLECAGKASVHITHDNWYVYLLHGCALLGRSSAALSCRLLLLSVHYLWAPGAVRTLVCWLAVSLLGVCQLWLLSPPIALLAWVWLIDVSNSIVMLFDRCFGRTLFGVSSDGFIIIVGGKWCLYIYISISGMRRQHGNVGEPITRSRRMFAQVQLSPMRTDVFPPLD